MLYLNRCVAHHEQQLFMIQDVIFARGDVQITDQNGFFRGVRLKRIAHVGQVIELLPELLINLPVGFITACGNIKIVDCDAVFQTSRYMARMP